MPSFRLTTFVVLGFLSPAFADKPIKFDPIWKGSVEDADLAKEAPTVLVSQKALTALWEKWKLEGKTPEVDFEKHFAVLVTTRGSVLNLGGSLKDDGDLAVQATSTRDIRPGFRYAIGVMPRGPKTVNGKPLPKE